MRLASYHAIVELVGHQSVAGAVEFIVSAICRGRAKSGGNTRDKQRRDKEATEDLES